MAQGFLGGVVWGGVLCVAVAGTVSVLAPPLRGPQVSDAAPGAVQAPQPVAGQTGASARSGADSAPVSGQAAPLAPSPQVDNLAALQDGTATPLTRPETGSAAPLDTPAEAPTAGGIALEGDAPVLPNPQSLAPMAPQGEEALALNTTPADPPSPPSTPVEIEQNALEAVTPEEKEQAPAETQTAQPDALEGEGAPEGEDAPVETADAAEPETQEAEPAPGQSAVVPETLPQEVETAQTDAPQIAPVDPPAVVRIRPAPAQTEEAETAQTRPGLGTPAISLTERSNGVTIRRPGAADTSEEAGTQSADATPPDRQNESDLRPIERYAQPFEPEADKPLMSIVLIDDGTQPTAGAAGIAALRNFPYALSFAVDSSLPDAAERMALYRDKGFEVVAMIDLPEGAQPTDAETTFSVTLPKLTQVVGVLEGTAGGLQPSKDVSDQVTAILSQSGHGLITQARGLNTMPKLARREGVPADPVFRDFDSKGQTARVIRRFLDQAAFKAGQEGAVIMLGRLRPDTISALLLWGLQDRASSVSLAPISAVLLRDMP